MAGSEQALQRAKGLAAVHLERIKEEYLRWSQLHRERGIQRSQSETGGEWGRRTPGRGSGGGRGGTGSRGSTLGDYILETPPARVTARSERPRVVLRVVALPHTARGDGTDTSTPSLRGGSVLPVLYLFIKAECSS